MLTAEDDRMVEAVLTGDDDAFGHIVRKYEKPIFNLMYRATGSMDEAADLTQDAFLRAYDKIHTFRPGKKFYPWLYSLSINLARDHLRKKSRRPEMASLDPDNVAQMTWSDSNAADEADRSTDSERLQQTLRTLSINDREAVLLRFRDGLKMKEIAERLGLSLSGAKMRVHRGLEKLQKAWGEKKHDG
jgi:RNA polymerase sigma-70 factor (ECF subfamily)